jgi:hypothetical protein
MPMQNAARWFVEFILEPFAPLKGKLREGLTMTLGFKYEALHTLVQRAPLKNHVMLTPSAQLRACSGRHLAVWRCMPLQNTMRWFAPLTMTQLFTGIFNETLCHADPFGAAQGMLREASHRRASRTHCGSTVPWHIAQQ